MPVSVMSQYRCIAHARAVTANALAEEACTRSWQPVYYPQSGNEPPQRAQRRSLTIPSKACLSIRGLFVRWSSRRRNLRPTDAKASQVRVFHAG
jgi:hypothetical protein